MALCHSITHVCLTSYIWPSVHNCAATSLDITHTPQLSLGFIPYVPYISYMTSSIPDSISTSALEAFAETAKPDVKLPPKKMTPDEMQDLIISDVEDSTDKFDNPTVGYKITAHYALYKLFQMHNHMHSQAIKDGNEESALCFARDAGWIQLMMKGLQDIQCGRGDYMCPIDED